MKMLLLGRTRSIFEHLRPALESAGIEATFTSDLDNAATDFSAVNFDLVAFGGGVDDALAEVLKGKFRKQNPNILFQHVFAPIGLQQLLKIARDGGIVHVWGDEPSISEDDTACLLLQHIKRACHAEVQVYQAVEGFPVESVFSGPVGPGTFRLPIDKAHFGASLNFVVVTLNGDEYYSCRVDLSSKSLRSGSTPRLDDRPQLGVETRGDFTRP